MSGEDARGAGRGGRTGRPRVWVHESARGLELRVDGTYASCYRRGSPLTGSVWDAIAAPLLALAPERRARILLLGLGAGSAARVARALAPRAHIVGVELDAEVLHAARSRFDLDALGLEVVQADARVFLERERRRFDAVLDDIFVGSGRGVRKPDWLPDPGLALAAQRLAPGGVLVSNALDEAAATTRTLRRLLGAGVSITVEGYDNRIVAAGPAPLSAPSLRAALAESAVLAPTLPKLRLRSWG